jgi:hypothetical protein
MTADEVDIMIQVIIEIVNEKANKYQLQLKYILEQMGAILESANLSHNRDHDPSIGVAFAQFVSVGAAQEFMEKHGRDIVIGNYTASLRYWRSSRREDWECQQCHLINFHHRRECYMCGIPRRGKY